jgi:non-homologous end joining protein Ku
MAFRSGIIIQLGTITGIVDVDNAVQSAKSLSNVCLGPTGTEHLPAQVKQQPLKCPECDNSDPSTMKKARIEAKQFIVVDPEEVTAARSGSVGATNKFISLLAHPAEEVHTQTIQGGSAYQLKPSTQGMVDVYSLLLDTITRHEELAFTALWSPAGRQNFYEVRAYGSTLVMEERARTENMKIVQQAVTAIPAAFQAQVDAILGVSVVPYDVAAYQDAYLKKLEEVLATRQAQDGILADKSKAGAPVAIGSVDLSAMLGAGLAAVGLAA